MKGYSFPKPLNMIHGKPAIAYTLKSIPAALTDFHFVYSSHLKQYNFEEVIVNLFKDRRCTFVCIDYFTRGPVETAWLGVEWLNEDEPILFLDNDNVYEFPSNFDLNQTTAFVGCKQDLSGSTAFSFVQKIDDRITAIKEKQRISDTYCIGAYGFKSKRQFQAAALHVLGVSNEKEVYMSQLFDYILKTELVKYIEFPSSTHHIGSIIELESRLPSRKMRICFDLDNTLVTYPAVPGDYTTVKPIERMVSYVKRLRCDGHVVIIYTARRMATHGSNVGAALKDIGKITFDTLEKFGIEYDEIIFGKPIADVYIDDRAVNPYRRDMASMGLFNIDTSDEIINQLPTNRYNTLALKNNKVVKSGSSSLLRGQEFFYKNYPRSLTFFPAYYSSSEIDGTIRIEMEYIRGISLFHLLKHKLLTFGHIDRLFDILEIMHHTHTEAPLPTLQELSDSYINKFQQRLSDKDVYPEDTSELVSHYTKLLVDYTSTSLTCVPVIHGDFWLSNLMLSFKGDIVCLDMKGSVGQLLTLGGDPLYDYAKLYQSLLGYDCCLWGCAYDSDYKNSLISYFHERVGSRLANIKLLTAVLMMGSLHAVESADARSRLWKWLETINNDLLIRR